MFRKFKKIIIFFIALVVTVSILGIYKFNFTNDDLYISGSSLNDETINKYIVGSWVMPIPGDEKEVQGFILNKDRSANSINMATLQYQKWKIQGDKLILTSKSIGNKTSFVEDEVYTIISVGEDQLFLKYGEAEYTYRRK